jgi:hypothetical protein
VFEITCREEFTPLVVGLGSQAGLSDVEVLADFPTAFDTTEQHESESIEKRYSDLPRKWYGIVTS